MNQNGSRRKNSFLTRRRLFAVAFSLALLAVIFTGASFALLKMNTGAVENTFSKGSVGAEIVETFTGTAKTAVSVKNTGDSPAYVRVKLVSYWKNEDDTIAAKDSPSISFVLNSANWTAKGDYYYYNGPLAGNAKTKNLIQSGSQIQLNSDEDGRKQVVEVLAEVVQATPDDAVKQLWGDDVLNLLK